MVVDAVEEWYVFCAVTCGRGPCPVFTAVRFNPDVLAVANDALGT